MSRNGELIQLHVGQCGIQIANACWELYCLEHNILPNGCLASYDDSYNLFFGCASGGKVVPRLVMVDTEPTVIDEIRTGTYRHLFNPNTLITGKDDAASNYGRAYYTLGSEMIDYTMNAIRKVAETCHTLQGFIMFRSLGGGTGSGLGNLLWDRIRSDYGKLSKIEFVIFPSPSTSSVVVESYNCVLSSHLGMDNVDCSVILDNEGLYNICASKLDVHSPTFTNINRIIGQAVSTFTASLRFEGSSNIKISEFATNLIPYPRIHFAIASMAPLTGVTKCSFDSSSTRQLTNACFEPGSQLANVRPNLGKYMSCVVMYRGDISPADINISINEIKSRSALFTDWSPAGFKIGLNYMPPTQVFGGDICKSSRAVCMISNNTCVRSVFCRIAEKFKKLYQKRAFIHHFIGEGIEEGTFTEALENIKLLTKDYELMDASGSEKDKTNTSDDEDNADDQSAGS